MRRGASPLSSAWWKASLTLWLSKRSTFWVVDIRPSCLDKCRRRTCQVYSAELVRAKAAVPWAMRVLGKCIPREKFNIVDNWRCYNRQDPKWTKAPKWARTEGGESKASQPTSTASAAQPQTAWSISEQTGVFKGAQQAPVDRPVLEKV